MKWGLNKIWHFQSVIFEITNYSAWTTVVRKVMMISCLSPKQCGLIVIRMQMSKLVWDRGQTACSKIGQECQLCVVLLNMLALLFCNIIRSFPAQFSMFHRQRPFLFLPFLSVFTLSVCLSNMSNQCLPAFVWHTVKQIYKIDSCLLFLDSAVSFGCEPGSEVTVQVSVNPGGLAQVKCFEWVGIWGSAIELDVCNYTARLTPSK